MKTVIAFCAILLLTFASIDLYACSCLPKNSVQAEVKSVDAVLVGTVLSKSFVTVLDSSVLKSFPNDTTMLKSPFYTNTFARYNFLVENIYKGEISKDTVTIYTGVGGGDCGIKFDVGKKYIIYGRKERYIGNDDFKFPKGKNIFWTDLCLRTTTYFKGEIAEIEKFAKKQTYKLEG